MEKKAISEICKFSVSLPPPIRQFREAFKKILGCGRKPAPSDPEAPVLKLRAGTAAAGRRATNE